MSAKQYFLKLLIHALCWFYPLVTACRIMFSDKPFIDHKCVPNAALVPSIHHNTGLPQCEWRCLKMKQCRYLNYDGNSSQCELGFGQCMSLLPAPGVFVNAYGPDRNTCLHWGSDQHTRLIPVELYDGHLYTYVVRLAIGQELVIGKLMVDGGRIYVNHDGTVVSALYDATLGHELLMSDPDCTLSWVQYTPHTDIPSGAVIGGHMADGSPTYVVKVNHVHNGNIYVVLGYYTSKTGMAYFEFVGPISSNDMMILILLWHFKTALYVYNTSFATNKPHVISCSHFADQGNLPSCQWPAVWSLDLFFKTILHTWVSLIHKYVYIG